jgi:hypothetical protein
MSQHLSPIYTIQTLSTSSTPMTWEGVNAISEEISQGFVLLWQHHAIFSGVVESGEVSWLNDDKPVAGDEHFLRLRAFNEAKEYHFWRSGHELRGRLRIDSMGDEQEAIDTQMLLRGVVGRPLQKANVSLAYDNLAVVTRNYIDYAEATHQAGFTDSRFVTFQPFNTRNK